MIRILMIIFLLPFSASGHGVHDRPSGITASKEYPHIFAVSKSKLESDDMNSDKIITATWVINDGE